MEDFIKSIKAHLYDRATSPLFGTFAVSWVLWNYKFVVIVFSSMEAHEKFYYISAFIYPSTQAFLLSGLLYPLLTTLAFIFLYPYPAKFVYSFTRQRQKELKEIKQQIEDETPLTHEESRKLRRDMAALELEYEKELERRGAENQILKDLIEELKREVHAKSLADFGDREKPKSEEDGEPSEAVSEEQVTLLELVSRDAYPFERDLVKLSKTHKVKTEFNLGELCKMSLIDRQDSAEGTFYSITHEGRTLLVGAGIIK